MTNNLDLMSNLPLLFFGFCFFVDFVLFLWGGITLLIAKGETQRTQKGRGILSTAFIGFFVILLIALVFYSVTFLLKKGEVFRPLPGVSGEFPLPAHLESFPPPPEFIAIGNYYFTGPWPLENIEGTEKAAIIAVLCKKNGEYDILYIGTRAGREQYQCWLENCNQNLKNLYLAVFWTPKERYSPAEIAEIEKELNNQINPPCSYIK